MKQIIFAIIFVFLLPMGVSGTEIQFRENVVARSPMLKIGDIAEIHPSRAADNFSGIELFRAPGHGEERCYNSGTLMAYIRETIPGDIDFSGADIVCVRHDADLVGQNEIVSMVNLRLNDALGPMQAENVRFVPRNAPDNISLPTGNVDYEVLFSSPDIISSRQVSVIIRVDGRVRHNLVVPGEIQAFLPVVVASEKLERGMVIGREHVRTEMKNINGLREPCTDMDEVVGKKLKRPININSVLSKSDLDFPILVERRQIVTMIVNKGTLQISTQGQAMSSGREGDMIMIKNIRSSREVPGRIIGPGLAKVDF